MEAQSCEHCDAPCLLLLRVRVYTGHVPGTENQIPETQEQWWCRACVEEEEE